MSSTLTSCLSLIVSVFRSIVDFAFTEPHPGFSVITIGAVLVGIFMINLGFDYLDFFLGGGSSIREDKK